MSATVQSDGGNDSGGSVNEPEPYHEDNEEHVVDPTAMSGTLDTSDTSGRMTSAADVSPVFDVADQQAIDNPVAPEGTLASAEIDPAAEGEDALKPTYTGQPNALSDTGRTPDPDGNPVGPGDEVAPDGSVTPGDTGNPVGDGPSGEQFDPGEHTVAEVQDHLSGADETERNRVLEAERAGKGRTTLLPNA